MKFEILYKDEPYTVICNIFTRFADISVIKLVTVTTKGWFGKEKTSKKIVNIGSGIILINENDDDLSEGEFIIDYKSDIKKRITKIIELKDKDVNKYQMIIDCSDEIGTLYSEPDVD